MEEMWKDIVGYEGLYQVSNKGNVRTTKRQVAQAFIPNPDGLHQVNHKDQNPSNNMVDNLEWCTMEYNMNYGTIRERQKDTCYKKGIWYTDYSYLLKIDRKEYARLYYLEHREEILERQKRQKKLKYSGKSKERDDKE